MLYRVIPAGSSQCLSVRGNFLCLYSPLGSFLTCASSLGPQFPPPLSWVAEDRSTASERLLLSFIPGDCWAEYGILAGSHFSAKSVRLAP